jgi:hypothetical protein
LQVQLLTDTNACRNRLDITVLHGDTSITAVEGAEATNIHVGRLIVFKQGKLEGRGDVVRASDYLLPNTNVKSLFNGNSASAVIQWPH